MQLNRKEYYFYCLAKIQSMRSYFFMCLFCLFAFTTLSVSAQQRYATLNHVAIYVKDLSTSTRFYKDLIGLENIPEPFHDGRHTWFKVGEHAQLHLIEGAKEKTTHDKNSHLCFTVADMDAFINRLTRAGVAYEDWPGKPNSITTRPDDVKQIYFKDPDGFWIEVNNDTY